MALPQTGPVADSLYGFDRTPDDSLRFGVWRERIEGVVKNPRARGFENTRLRIDRYYLRLDCTASCWNTALGQIPYFDSFMRRNPIGTSFYLGKTDATVDFTGEMERKGGLFEWSLGAVNENPVWAEDGSLNPAAPLLLGGEVNLTILAPSGRPALWDVEGFHLQVFGTVETTVGDTALKAKKAALSLTDLKTNRVLLEADLTRDINGRYLDRPNYEMDTFYAGARVLGYLPGVQPFLEIAALRLNTVLNLNYTDDGRELIDSTLGDEEDQNGFREGRIPLEEWGGSVSGGVRVPLTQPLEELLETRLPVTLWLEGDGAAFWIPEQTSERGDTKYILFNRFRGSVGVGI